MVDKKPIVDPAYKTEARHIIVISHIPKWANFYLMYGAKATLTPDDVRMVDTFVENLREEGYRLLGPAAGYDMAYDQMALFGLPCYTGGWNAERVNNVEF